MTIVSSYIPLYLLLLSINVAGSTIDNPSPIPSLPVTIIQTAAHNPSSFTQGWIKDEGVFFESSGYYGRSFIQRYSDKNTATIHLPKQYFAEGLTLFNGLLYLLTWKEQTLFILDKNSLAIKEKLKYQGEGWGLTHNKEHLIMSDGSSTLLFRDPSDFSIQGRITVKKALQLNELEYVNGVIWANDWNNDSIYAINSQNGCLLATMDISAIRKKTVNPDASNVVNGIAYDKEQHGLWITGKYWPSRYLIPYPKLNTETAC